MKTFALLYAAIEGSTKTNAKLAAMAAYFSTASPADAAWALYFLSGRRLRRLVKSATLREAACVAAGIPMWLFEECYDVTGDLAETMALLPPEPDCEERRTLHALVEEELLVLYGMRDEDVMARVLQMWRCLTPHERLVWNKLITGEFRVGVSQGLVLRALSQVSGIEPAVIAHRMMGTWEPGAAFYEALLHPDTQDAHHSRPYPFFLAHPLEQEPHALGDVAAWQVEWKWDGIRAQLVRRGGATFLWSRGEELVTERFPEVVAAAEQLPQGLVLDGELLAWNSEGVMPFAALQTRIGRKSLSRRLLADVPVHYVVFDLLEAGGEDWRLRPMRERRRMLEGVLASLPPGSFIHPSPMVEATSWEEMAALRETSRERHVEGFMLKALDSPYGTGRERGPWWKWKVEPYSVDAVLLYAQRGHGRRASLYTDYTFGIWKGQELVPFAKAYSGLTDAEILQVDQFVRKHTLEKFGPVRHVEPKLVFELGFEGIQESRRHRSGIAVRFPRMLRWRQDKSPEEADTIETVRALLPGGGA
jgi:DNA ligase-1